MVPYGTICGSAETVGVYLYAAYTQPIRSYTPDLYAQSIRQIHLYAAYTSGYTPGPIRQNTVLRGVGRPAPFRNGHQKCCPTSAKNAVIP